jgi:polyhydroxyalkanoate synthesis repressor PhaR
MIHGNAGLTGTAYLQQEHPLSGNVATTDSRRHTSHLVIVMAYVIKRYTNRKLYDPQTSGYVTLEEIEAMIRLGKEISVMDVATGEDITSVVLAQILLEKERQHRTALPTAFLHQLIQYGAAWQDVALQSLQASLGGLLASQREADRVVREWAARYGWPVPAAPTPPAAPLSEAAAEIAAVKREMAALREQVQALTRRLDKQQE